MTLDIVPKKARGIEVAEVQASEIEETEQLYRDPAQINDV